MIALKFEVSVDGEAFALASLSSLLADLVDGIDAPEVRPGKIQITLTPLELKQMRFLVNEVSVRALRLEAALEGGH